MSWDNWVRGVEVEPSVYAGDFSNLGMQLRAVLDAGARIIHFDVGDGHFIDEITMGPIVLRSIADLVHQRGGVLDCHMMVAQPAGQFEQVKAAGGDSVTFHIEADDEPVATIARARDVGLGVGVACNPETPVDRAVTAAAHADVVLCMSIHPGLSGQEFMAAALPRVAEVRRQLPASTLVQVDGGIHRDNVAAVRRAGADLLVSGSGVFWDDDPGAAYQALAAAASTAKVDR